MSRIGFVRNGKYRKLKQPYIKIDDLLKAQIKKYPERPLNNYRMLCNI